MTDMTSAPGAALTLADLIDPVGDPFVIEWQDGSYSAKPESWVSDSWDRGDMEDGVRAIYARGNDGTLQRVLVGSPVKINTDQEYPVRYAQSEILTEDGRRVGFVTWTDH